MMIYMRCKGDLGQARTTDVQRDVRSLGHPSDILGE
ncbi:hypothetical protein AYX14_07182 [Cryptococcus neoformans]|nr:hypothetical protein AYX14_07182 [Cryptococcus neoformans var. grubii]